MYRQPSPQSPSPIPPFHSRGHTFVSVYAPAPCEKKHPVRWGLFGSRICSHRYGMLRGRLEGFHLETPGPPGTKRQTRKPPASAVHRKQHCGVILWHFIYRFCQQRTDHVGCRPPPLLSGVSCAGGGVTKCPPPSHHSLGCARYFDTTTHQRTPTQRCVQVNTPPAGIGHTNSMGNW